MFKFSLQAILVFHILIRTHSIRLLIRRSPIHDPNFGMRRLLLLVKPLMCISAISLNASSCSLEILNLRHTFCFIRSATLQIQQSRRMLTWTWTLGCGGGRHRCDLLTTFMIFIAFIQSIIAKDWINKTWCNDNSHYHLIWQNTTHAVPKQVHLPRVHDHWKSIKGYTKKALPSRTDFACLPTCDLPWTRRKSGSTSKDAWQPFPCLHEPYSWTIENCGSGWGVDVKWWWNCVKGSSNPCSVYRWLPGASTSLLLQDKQLPKVYHQMRWNWRVRRS